VYAGTPELPAAVEASIRAQQNNDASVSMGLAAAKILEKVCDRQHVRLCVNTGACLVCLLQVLYCHQSGHHVMLLAKVENNTARCMVF
jgi:hypothetical protein